MPETDSAPQSTGGKFEGILKIVAGMPFSARYSQNAFPSRYSSLSVSRYI